MKLTQQPSFRVNLSPVLRPTFERIMRENEILSADEGLYRLIIGLIEEYHRVMHMNEPPEKS